MMDRSTPWYLSRTRGARLSDISDRRLAWFIERARTEREFKFESGNSPEAILDQLGLRDGQHLLNAALLLFADDPQRFCPYAVVKCSHYYGLEVTRPIPSQHTYGGTLFAQIDSAVDFVLSKIVRSVGSRQAAAGAEVRLEIPSEAITEVIVNAVVHRNYDSNGSVQVSVFSDRVEVVNPGRLPDELTEDDLAKTHLSIPVNPFIARPFYLAGYINQLGYGTLNVIRYCHEAGLPPPVFKSSDNEFRVVLWRDVFSDEILNELGVSDRQRKGIAHVKRHGRIVNGEYQKIAAVQRKTAARDLDDLVAKGVLIRIGEKRGAYYVLRGSRS